MSNNLSKMSRVQLQKAIEACYGRGAYIVAPVNLSCITTSGVMTGLGAWCSSSITSTDIKESSEEYYARLNKKLAEALYGDPASVFSSQKPYVPPSEEHAIRTTTCECGAVKARSTHATWCPCYKGFGG